MKNQEYNKAIGRPIEITQRVVIDMEPNTEKARELQREYLKQWRAKNKDKVRRYNQEYWKRKAAEREETNGKHQ